MLFRSGRQLDHGRGSIETRPEIVAAVAGRAEIVLDGGVQRVNWAFVAGRWASPFWQVWDLLMLWLAMIHGTNGLRTIINDYTRKDGTRLALKGLLYTATTITIAIRRLLARFPEARLADPDFVPVYGGAVGELRLQHLPMVMR